MAQQRIQATQAAGLSGYKLQTVELMNGTATGGTRIVDDLRLTCIMTVTSKIGQSNGLEGAAQVYPAFMEL